MKLYIKIFYYNDLKFIRNEGENFYNEKKYLLIKIIKIEYYLINNRKYLFT